jgi:hypothetical protein
MWHNGALYSLTMQGVAGSIPAPCKHLCACLFVLDLGVSMHNVYVLKKYISIY